MLLDSQIALRAICRPAVLSEEQAWDLVQSALVFDPLFGGKLVRHLLEGRLWPGEVPLEEIMRVLSILENIPDIGRITMTLLKFIRYPNNRVHSKVAKILGHHLDNTPVLLELLRHPDARVRANLVEGIGYRKSTAGCAQYLDEAAKDQNHRVSSMALAIKARDGHAVSLALIQMRNRSKARI